MENRIIKFREFVNGKFHYWGFVEEGIFKGPVTPSLTRGQHSQFTGLLDKNGKEIFEGDIVSFKTGRYPNGTIEQVRFDQSGAWYPFNDPRYIEDEQGDWFEGDDPFEIIGNIYENKGQDLTSDEYRKKNSITNVSGVGIQKP